MKTQEQGVTSLYHNTWLSSYWLTYIQRSNAPEGRDGDEVFLQRLVTKVHINTKPDRQSMMVRAMLVRVPANHSTTVATDLFEGGTNAILAFPKVNEMRILAQKVVKLQGDTVWSSSDTTQKDLSATIVLNTSLGNRKTKYLDDYPKDYYIRLLVVAYDSHGTLTTDNIADMMVSSRIYFKDP